MTRVCKDRDHALEGDFSPNRSSEMSSASTTSQPSALPVRQQEQLAEPTPSLRPQPDTETDTDTKSQSEPDRSNEQLTNRPQTLCPDARLRIHLEDIAHPAVAAFTNHIPLATIIRTAVAHVQAQLFTPPSDRNSTPSQSHPDQSRPTPPPKSEWTPQEVRSITLLLRDIDGVAYTTGTDLDNAHKEIHLSLNYVHVVIKRFTSAATSSSSTSSSSSPNATIATRIITASPVPSPPPPPPPATVVPTPKLDPKPFTHEMFGVITHEMVHCFQHNGKGSCPGGLIEGIADYVRMRCGLSAPHWKKYPANKDTRGDKWDEGYQKTAWFLEWVEQEIGGPGCIGRLNERMRDHEWSDGKLWENIMNGVSVEECWVAYKSAWEGMKEGRTA